MLLAPAHPIILPPDYAGAIVTVQRLPELLDKARFEQGLTLTAQAKRIGIALSTLSGMYTNAWNPKLTTIVAILRYLVVYTP